jgi:hypothetical protein
LGADFILSILKTTIRAALSIYQSGLGFFSHIKTKGTQRDKLEVQSVTGIFASSKNIQIIIMDIMIMKVIIICITTTTALS